MAAKRVSASAASALLRGQVVRGELVGSGARWAARSLSSAVPRAGLMAQREVLMRRHGMMAQRRWESSAGTGSKAYGFEDVSLGL